MIKKPQNKNIAQRFLYRLGSGKKAMGFREANEASDPEVRRQGVKRFAVIVGRIALIAGVAGGSLFAASKTLPETITAYPTVKEFDKIFKKSNENPNALSVDEKKVLSDFEKTVIQPGDTAFGIAEETQPDSDNRKVSDLLIAEDKANEVDGIGHTGFDAGDPLIVHKAPTEK